MRKSHFICLILGLALMFVGPAVGLLTTVVGMTRAFKAIQADKSGATEALSQSVSRALGGTVVGLCAGAVGLAIAIVAILLHFAVRESRRRAAAQRMAPISFLAPRSEKDE